MNETDRTQALTLRDEDFAHVRARANNEQWLELAQARDAQEHLAMQERARQAREPFREKRIEDRWWFWFLGGIAIVLLLWSLYVLSCGANPSGCTL